MNNLDLCIADLLDNYDLPVLLDYADDDDGAYTIVCYGSSFDVATIADALVWIADNSDNLDD